MNKLSNDRLKGSLIVPVGLAVILVPFSLLLGWNPMTLILFWFVLVPATAMLLPTLVSRSNNHLIESVAGLIIFYGIMVFMIYDHYKTDYFRVMTLSCIINVILVSVITRTIGSSTQTQ